MTAPMHSFAHAERLAPQALFAAPHWLSTVEAQVVSLARRDALASLLPPRGRSMRLLRWCGVRLANRLADPRLEALRRYAVLLRHGGDTLAAPARRTLARIGLSEAQIRHARWLAMRAASPRT